MQCDEKLRLLQNIQIQALAFELEKAEAEDLVEEVCKEVATMSDVLTIVSACDGYHGTTARATGQHRHCSTALVRVLRQVTEPGEANKP